MVQKMPFCFSNISAEILLHVLGYSFCMESKKLAHFWQMLLSLNYLCKSCSDLAPKMLVKLTPWDAEVGLMNIQV
jgi:hypothetical protein